MHIASIDPGVTTGLVIAYIKPRVDQVTITPVLVEDIVTNHSVIMSHAIQYRCRNVFMEQKPAHPSKEGLDNWEFLFQKFTATYGYMPATTGKIQDHPSQHKVLWLIQPSHWKPFMKARTNLLPKNLPHHAKDACMMLHYSIQINYPDKEIIWQQKLQS